MHTYINTYIFTHVYYNIGVIPSVIEGIDPLFVCRRLGRLASIWHDLRWPSPLHTGPRAALYFVYFVAVTHRVFHTRLPGACSDGRP